MAKPNVLQGIIDVLVFVVLKLKSAIYDPIADFFLGWVDIWISTGEESTKSVLRECFSVVVRSLNGISAWFVSIFVDPSYYRKLRTNLTKSHPWTSWWENDATSTFNAIIERDKAQPTEPETSPTADVPATQGSTGSGSSGLRGPWGPWRRRSTPSRETTPSREMRGVKRTASDLFETKAGWAAAAGDKRRGVLEDLRLWSEMAVEALFGMLRGAVAGVRALLLRPNPPHQRGGRRHSKQGTPGSGHLARRPPTGRRRSKRGGTEGWTTADVIRAMGYPLEEHEVITQDGYIIHMNRIPRKDAQDAVFFLHGIFDTELGWVSNGVTGSQAFAAYDQGLDVWLASSRSNPPRKHIDSQRMRWGRYYYFSVNELAMYDVGAQLDYVDAVKRRELRQVQRFTPPPSHSSSSHTQRENSTGSSSKRAAAAAMAAGQKQDYAQCNGGPHVGPARGPEGPVALAAGQANAAQVQHAGMANGGVSSSMQGVRTADSHSIYSAAALQQPGPLMRPDTAYNEQESPNSAALHKADSMASVRHVNKKLRHEQDQDVAAARTGSQGAPVGPLLGNPVQTNGVELGTQRVASHALSPDGSGEVPEYEQGPLEGPTASTAGPHERSAMDGWFQDAGTAFSSVFEGSNSLGGFHTPQGSHGSRDDIPSSCSSLDASLPGSPLGPGTPLGALRRGPEDPRQGLWGPAGAGREQQADEEPFDSPEASSDRSTGRSGRDPDRGSPGPGSDDWFEASEGDTIVSESGVMAPDLFAQGGVEQDPEQEAAPISTHPSGGVGSHLPDLPTPHASEEGTRGEVYNLRAVGHSLGGAVLLTYLVKRRLDGKRHHISRLVLLTPAGFLFVYPMLAKFFLWVLPPLARILNALAPGRGGPIFLPSRWLRAIVFKLAVDLQHVKALQDLVVAFISWVLGKDPSEWGAAVRMPHYNSASMPCLSIHVGVHMCQWVKSRAFRMFDYGSPTANARMYGGQTMPPDIGGNYALIDAPVDLLAGRHDGIVAAANVRHHFEVMRDAGVRVTYKEFEFGHLDFVIAQKEELRHYVQSRLLAG